MRGQDDSCIGRQQAFEGRQRGQNPAVVGDLSVRHRHVQVGSNEDALSRDGNHGEQGIEGLNRHGRTALRLEGASAARNVQTLRYALKYPA